MMCYDCAVENVHLEKTMFERQSVDLTWVFLHQVYMVTLTIIWTLYNPEIRRMHPKHEVEGHIRCQIELILALAELWPGAEAAADLFARLAGAALRNYETDLRRSPTSTHDSVSTTTPPSRRCRDQYSPQSSHERASPYSCSDNGRSSTDTPSPHPVPVIAAFGAVYDSNVLDAPRSSAFRLSASPSRAPTSPPPRASMSPPAIPAPVPSRMPLPPTTTAPAPPSYRDFQGMIFDPNYLTTFAPSNPQQNQGIPDWLQAWDPHVPVPSNGGTTAPPPVGFGPPITASPPPPPPLSQPQQDLNYMGQTPTQVLNQQAQHDELMRILENEALQFDFEDSSAQQQQQRPWGFGDGFF